MWITTTKTISGKLLAIGFAGRCSLSNYFDLLFLGSFVAMQAFPLQAVVHTDYYYYYYYHFTTLCPGLPMWVGTRRIIHSFLNFAEAEMVGWQWHQLNHMQTICTSLQKITTPAPHHSDFYGPDALPDTQPTASKQWRHMCLLNCWKIQRKGRLCLQQFQWEHDKNKRSK